MDPAALLKIFLLLGVVLTVVGIGAQARPEVLLNVLRRPDLGFRAFLAMFVVQPAFVILMVWALDLTPGVGAALLGFAVSPVLPPWAKKGFAIGAPEGYVLGIEVISAIASILVIPFMLGLSFRVFGVRTALDPWSAELMLLVTIGAPLAVGMGLAKLKPAAAPRIASRTDRAGTVILAVGILALIVTSWRPILSVIGRGTIVVSVLVIAFGLLAGHVLGGPGAGRRGALATATVSRHPGLALLLATGTLPDAAPAILATVLLYLVASMLVPIPYERWLRRTHPAETSAPAA